jgi:ribosomal protein S18 acetylase RimI-like enzyme
MDDKFRLAVIEDSAAIVLLYKNAVKLMRSQNIDQWDEIYPNEDIILNDIEKRQMYLLVKNTKIASAVVLNEEQDEEYKKGDWSCKDGNIAVLHRLCVHPNFQNMGVGRETLLCVESVLIEAGYSAIRLDTFVQNPKALRLYDRLDYKQTGTVTFRKGEFCLFEKLLQPRQISSG